MKEKACDIPKHTTIPVSVNGLSVTTWKYSKFVIINCLLYSFLFYPITEFLLYFTSEYCIQFELSRRELTINLWFAHVISTSHLIWPLLLYFGALCFRYFWVAVNIDFANCLYDVKSLLFKFDLNIWNPGNAITHQILGSDTGNNMRIPLTWKLWNFDKFEISI